MTMAKNKHKCIDMDHDTFNERLGQAKENTARAQKIARDFGITHRSTMGHEELIDAIQKAEPSDEHAAM